MKPYIKNYLNFFGIYPGEFIPCEVCGASAVDIHHIKARGMGGSNNLNGVENCMALCRACHLEYGDKTDWCDMLQIKHRQRILQRGKVDQGELKRFLI